VLAALARVVGDGIAVVGPKRQVAAGDVSALDTFLRLLGANQVPGVRELTLIRIPHGYRASYAQERNPPISVTRSEVKPPRASIAARVRTQPQAAHALHQAHPNVQRSPATLHVVRKQTPSGILVDLANWPSGGQIGETLAK
jgi:hypothetical protein